MLRPKEASRLVVPIAALYTPLKEKPETPLLQFEPVTCKQPCRSVLNPFWYDLRLKTMTCTALSLVSQLCRCSGPTMDMSILPVEKPAAASLQGHHGQCNPAGAASFQYHDRVPALQTCPKPSDIPLRCRHMPRGGQSFSPQGVASHEPQSFT